jgi:hypothetical protein
MWFGQCHMRACNVPMPEETKSQEPRSKHRGSAPGPRYSKFGGSPDPGQLKQAPRPSAQGRAGEAHSPSPPQIPRGTPQSAGKGHRARGAPRGARPGD